MNRIKDSYFLGNQLVEDGVVTRTQLDEAVMKQSQFVDTGNKISAIGHVLVSLGFCTEEQVAMTLAKKYGCLYYTINTVSVDLSAIRMLSREIIEKYKVIPLFHSEKKIFIAMKNPSDIIAIDDVRIITGLEIAPCIIPDSDFDYLMEHYVKISPANFNDVIDNLESAEIIPDNETEAISSRPIVQLTEKLIEQAVKVGASDVHIEPQEEQVRVRYRVDGVLQEMLTLSQKVSMSLISRIKVLANMNIAEKRSPQDGSISKESIGKDIEIRVATLPTSYGESATLRIINRGKNFYIKDLGLQDRLINELKNMIDIPHGFILITGPTGSGKSTSLYAVLSQLNTPDKKIITLEDPVEKNVKGVTQIQINPKAGMTFASGLRSILRSDPDIVMVGEIRDTETARISVEAALTGHLVLSTLHTNDAAGAISRLKDMGIEPYLTASSLVGVVAQRLVRVLCNNCKQQRPVSKEEIEKIVSDFPFDEGVDTYTMFDSGGCIHCNNTGYKGRVGVYEILGISDSIHKLILDRASANEIKHVAMSEGMVTLREDGLVKAKNGITTIEEVLRVVL